jgi:class 3 adenylate cyclase
MGSILICVTPLLTPEQNKQIRRLRFAGSVEAEFWADWSDRIREPVRKIAFFGFILCVLFVASTWFLVADADSRATNLRSVIAVVPLLFLSAYLTRTRFWPRFNPALLWTVILSMVVTNGYGMFTRDQVSYERAIISNWMFFSVIVIGSGLALVRSALVAVTILIGSYAFIVLGMRPLTEPAGTSNWIILGQTMLFALAAAYVVEIRARREFLLGKLLEEERHKTQELLSNVLPDEIAHRLKDGHKILAERHEQASVLFADIVDFTPYASSHDPAEVIGFLDGIFTRFDDLVQRRGLEKIKTVGDAYMVAGGVLDHKPGHLESMAELAIEMQTIARAAGTSMRIGLHCGPLVAGVIGRRKYLYDLWGETVNTASRMESHGLPDRIQVTRAIVDQLDGRFEYEKRGTIEVKGMGPVETYFLTGIHGPVSQVALSLREGAAD